MIPFTGPHGPVFLRPAPRARAGPGAAPRVLEESKERPYTSNEGENSMKSMIIDREILPETITSYIHAEKIRLVEENGTVTLSPVFDTYAVLEKSCGMFPDGKLSSARFAREKQTEKALER